MAPRQKYDAYRISKKTPSGVSLGILKRDTSLEETNGELNDITRA